MPELPEVETARRGIAPHLEGRRIERLTVRDRRLRWPVPAGLEGEVRGQTVLAVDRRGKYLLLRTASGTLILHLEMSGNLRIVGAADPPATHDHLDLVVEGGTALRLTDPRRVGCLPVVKDGRLVGLVTARSLMGIVAKLLEEKYVEAQKAEPARA